LKQSLPNPKTSRAPTGSRGRREASCAWNYRRRSSWERNALIWGICGSSTRSAEAPSKQVSLELLPALPTGLARYEPRPQRIKEDHAFGVWVLWGVLILAVILLSSLAFAIARSMRN
jgi:hypothetical protein